MSWTSPELSMENRHNLGVNNNKKERKKERKEEREEGRKKERKKERKHPYILYKFEFNKILSLSLTHTITHTHTCILEAVSYS